MYDAEQPQSSGEMQHSTVSWIELIRINIAQLIAVKAKVQAEFSVSDTISKSGFQQIYQEICDLYDYSKSVLGEDSRQEVGGWLQSVKFQQTDERNRAPEIAGILLDALETKGLKKLFEEPIAPPFLQEYDEDAEQD